MEASTTIFLTIRRSSLASPDTRSLPDGVVKIEITSLDGSYSFKLIPKSALQRFAAGSWHSDRGSKLGLPRQPDRQ
jgi:hypothetical protein